MSTKWNWRRPFARWTQYRVSQRLKSGVPDGFKAEYRHASLFGRGTWWTVWRGLHCATFAEAEARIEQHKLDEAEEARLSLGVSRRVFP